MKISKHISIVLMLIWFLFSWGNLAQTDQDLHHFMIDNVNIVDVKNKLILHKKNILIKNGIITAIYNQDETHDVDRVKVVKGQGGYLTPGLIDMHVHIYEPAAYLMTLSHGVTHVRTMNGVSQQLDWRDKVASGDMLGSTSTVSSPIISGYKEASFQHGVDTADEAKRAVAMYHNQGYDLIKAYGSLNQETLSAIVEEAKVLGIPVAKHGPHASGDMPVSALSGFQSFEHAEDIYQGPLNYKFNPNRLPDIIDEIKATQVPVTPTLNIFYQLMKISAEKESYLNRLPTHYMPTIIKLEDQMNQVKRWLNSSPKMAAHNKFTMTFLKHITQVLYKRDVPLLVGSDSGELLSPHGIATHTEMMLMEQAGMSKFDVLAAATIHPAKALRLQHKIGHIAPNMNADMIFTHHNPLEDLTILKAPVAVIKQGKWYSGQELNAMRDEAIEDRSLIQEIITIIGAM